MVSSTTPRLGARWPPVTDNCSMRNCRISPASCSSSSIDSDFRSAGSCIRSSSTLGSLLSAGLSFPGLVWRQKLEAQFRFHQVKGFPDPEHDLVGAMDGEAFAEGFAADHERGNDGAEHDADNRVINGMFRPGGRDQLEHHRRRGGAADDADDIADHVVAEAGKPVRVAHDL